MLETPTFGKFYGEDRFLVFEPAAPYLMLVKGCIFGGAAAALYGFVIRPLVGQGEFSWWWTMTGSMVCLAGIWADLSLVRIRFSLQERWYKRRQGPGFIPTLWQGKIDQLDAIQVISEQGSFSGMVGASVTHYIILHWKGRAAPPMVLETAIYALFPGSPLSTHAAGILDRANRYAKALKLPVYDNTQYHSPCPVAIWN